MKRSVIAIFAAALLCAAPAFAAEDEEFSFFRQEADFLSASLRATPMGRAPASVNVLTGEEIKASGASTIWDALRLVPGVDVVETRTGQGDVSIRGFDQSDSNRVLVLLNGRTVLQEFFGIAVWEQVPVSLDDIDRIEIVKGPASSLYGANAIHGVINIITKTPAQLSGGLAAAGAGSRDARTWTAAYGRRTGRWAWQLNAGGDRMDRFGGGELAYRTAKVRGQAVYRPGDGSELGLSGSLTRFNGQLGIYGNGVSRPLAGGGHLRADWRSGGFKARAFAVTSRVDVRDFWGGPEMDYDTYDFSADQEFRAGAGNTLVAGLGYRRNSVRADIFEPGLHYQDLYSAYLEDTWLPGEKWSVVTGARLDHHTLSGYAFSPRVSASYFPDERNTLRVSAGASYRNPTLVENYVGFTQTSAYPSPPYSSLAASFRGSRGLEPEKMQSVETAWEGVFGRFKAGLAVYGYLLTDLINTADPVYDPSSPPVMKLTSAWANTGNARAVGGEASAEYAFYGKAGLFGNYSYFHASESGRHNDSHNSPMHKGNAGLRWLGGPVTGMLWTTLAGPTWWDANAWGASPDLRRVAGYLLVSAGANWALGGGAELRLKAYNLLDKRHYEVLPYRGPSDAGQYGEIVGARYLAELAWSF